MNNDLQTIRVKIQAETAQFQQQIAAVQQKLQQLNNTVMTGGSIGKGEWKTLGKEVKGLSKEFNNVFKDFEKNKKYLLSLGAKWGTGDQTWNRALNSKGGAELRAQNEEYERMKIAIEQITEQYSQLEKHTAASASETRQQTNDMIAQSGVGEYIEYTSGQRTINEMMLHPELYTTEQLQKAIKDEVEATNEAQKKLNSSVSKGAGNFGKIVKHIVGFRILRLILSQILKELGDSLQQLVIFDADFNNNMLGYNQTLSDLTSNFKKLSASMTAAGMELLNVLAPVLNVIIAALTKIFNWFSALFAMLAGKSTYTVANPNYWQDYRKSVGGATGAVKELKKQLASFDELEILQDPSATSSGGGGIGGIAANDLYETRELYGWAKKVAEVIAKIREWIGNLWQKLKEMWDNASPLGKLAMAAAGVLALVAAYEGLKWIVDKVRDAFHLKNGKLSTQTALEGEEATQLVNVLNPAYGLVAAGALALALAVGEMTNQTGWSLENAKSKWVLALSTILLEIEAWKLNAWAKIQEFFAQFIPTNELGLQDVGIKWKLGLESILGIVIAWCISVSQSIGDTMSNIMSNIGEGISTAYQNVKDGFESMLKGAKEWGEGMITAAGEAASHLVSNIGHGVSSAISNINNLVEAYKNAKEERKASTYTQTYNSAISKGLKIAVATALAVGAVAALHFAPIALPAIASFLPAFSFANGGVVTAPTLSLTGEYPNARHNPEIITPENKMREVFNEGNTELAMLLDRNNRLLEQLLEKDNSITIGDDVISASAARGNMNYKKRTGRSQFAI